MRRINKLFNLNDPGWGRGNNNGSQPPRRPSRGDGPPDLDEVWRDFNNKLGSWLGRKGGQGGPGAPRPDGIGTPPGKRSPLGAVLLLLVVAGIWLASGFFIVQEGQVAVITQFGKYERTTGPGFQWRLPYPIQRQETVNISQLRVFEVGFRGTASSKNLAESLMLTNDENIVDMQFVVQYRLRADGAPDYLFKTRNPDESVRQAAETAMREIVGNKPMDFVLYEGRTEVAIEVQKLMQQILDRYDTGVQVESVAIQNVQPPEQVQAAFDDAVKAGQDRERQINEGQAYANQVVPLADGQASRMAQQAEGYKAKVVGDAQGNAARFLSILDEYTKAPKIMRERLYLETLQDMFSSSSKVLLDTKNSNNMMYLPLDKIMQQGARDNASASGPGGSLSRLSGATTSAVPPVPSRLLPASPPSGGAGSTGVENSGANSARTLTRDRMSR